MDGWLFRRRRRMELTNKQLPGTWGDASNLEDSIKEDFMHRFKNLLTFLI